MPGHHGKSGSSLGKSQGGQNNRERGADRNRSQTLSPDVRARNTAAMNKVKADRGRDKLTNYQLPKSKIPGVFGFVLNATQNLRQKSFEYNRDFFRNKVLTSKNRGNYVDTFDSYANYIRARGAGTIDAYGNPIGGGNDRDPNQTLLSKEPTSGIVTSDGIVGTNAVKTPEEIQEERNKESGIILAKKKGRSEMIQTSSKGLMDEDEIINRKQLLG